MTSLSLYFIGLCALAFSAPGGSLNGFGINHYGEAALPEALSEIVAFSAGIKHSVAVRSNGSVLAWGYDGDNLTAVPAQFAASSTAGNPPPSRVIAVDTGTYHTLALLADGKVTGWGFNGEHILTVPDGDLANGGSPVVAVAAGAYHSLALKGDGTVLGWGFREHERHFAPPELVGVVAIDAGRNHSLALCHTGSVVAWGDNADSQATVPPGLSGVIAISAGGSHNMALKEDGTVAAWGNNDFGQSDVPLGLAQVVAIAAGEEFSMALKTDGAIVTWGLNASKVRPSGDGWAAIAAGGTHSLALSGGGIGITRQPRSRTVLAGEGVTFSVEAQGTGLSYQWRYNGADIPGAIGATLRLSDVGRTEAGVYAVKVQGDEGDLLSRQAVLVVRRLHQMGAPVLLGKGRLRISFGDALGAQLVYQDLFRYRVEASEDLQIWTTLDAERTLVDGAIQVIETPNPDAPRRFYRVVEK